MRLHTLLSDIRFPIIPFTIFGILIVLFPPFIWNGNSKESYDFVFNSKYKPFQYSNGDYTKKINRGEDYSYLLRQGNTIQQLKKYKKQEIKKGEAHSDNKPKNNLYDFPIDDKGNVLGLDFTNLEDFVRVAVPSDSKDYDFIEIKGTYPVYAYYERHLDITKFLLSFLLNIIFWGGYYFILSKRGNKTI